MAKVFISREETKVGCRRTCGQRHPSRVTDHQNDQLSSLGNGRALVTAESIYQGRTQQLWQVEIRRDTDGELLARGQVRLQNVEPRPPT
jgi:hypothetical protein